MGYQTTQTIVDRGRGTKQGYLLKPWWRSTILTLATLSLFSCVGDNEEIIDTATTADSTSPTPVPTISPTQNPTPASTPTPDVATTPISLPTTTPNPVYNVPLDRTHWRLSASSNEGSLVLAIDGDTNTRWDTHQDQSLGDWLEIDLGESATFNRIILDSEASPNDYPISYGVFVSEDNANWRSAIVLGDGTTATTHIDFAAVHARFIRIEQYGSSDRYWWSIHEINILMSDDLTPGTTPTPSTTTIPTAIPTPAPTTQPSSIPTSAPTATPTDLPVPVATAIPTASPISTTAPTPTSTPTSTPNIAEYYQLGAHIYAAQCESCHGAITETLKRNRTAEQLASAIAIIPSMQNIQLSDDELAALAFALSNDDPNQPLACDTDSASHNPIRRITEGEYDNAVQTLLGVSMHNTTNLVADAKSGPFASNRGTPASAAAILNYLQSAELIAKLATQQIDHRYNWVLDASNNAGDVSYAIDGDPATRWSTGTYQVPDQWLTIDLGSVQRFNQIVLDHEASANDFPVSYEVTVSDDGTNWGSPLASNHGTNGNTLIDFDTVAARYIRITQLGSAARYYWSIHELNVWEQGRDTSPLVEGLSCETIECAETFVAAFARLAYRGALTTDELDTLKDILNLGDTVTDGIQLVIERVLQSPKFLYQIERSVPGSDSIERLTGLSIAEKLAAFLWNSIPDDALLNAAERGDLDTNTGVSEQAERMINDPRATAAFADFIEQWFDTKSIVDAQKDTEAYPEFDDSLAAAMRAETQAFVKWMVSNDQFNYQELLTSSKAFPGSALADFYHVTPAAEGEAVDLDERVGILTHPSLTASHAKLDDSSVVGRGSFILETLLCVELPEPPANVEALLAEIDPTLPTRDRLALHTQDPSCAGCHNLIDPLGFALESYDAIGAYRLDDNLGFPVETFGSLSGTDQDGEFDDIHGLVTRVVASETAKSCAVEQWMRFAQRRLLNTTDTCSINNVTQAFANSNYDFTELVRAVVTSDAFLFRDSTGENE